MAGIPRTARARARAAARRPPCDITWRYAHRRAVTALAVHRRRGCLAQAPRPRAAVRSAALHRITHVMSPAGVLRTGPALKHCGHACTQPRCACAHAHGQARARAAHAPARAHTRFARAPTWLAVECAGLRVESHRVFVTSVATRCASESWSGGSLLSSQCRTGHRRVKVEASCCANLDAPAPDAGWTRQQRPFRPPGKAEKRHV
jgi:hypothetical protein